MKTPEDVLKVVKPPFRYVPEGQIIMDSSNQLVLDVRGWGMFQYHDGGDELQDAFGEMVAAALNDKYSTGGAR